MKNDLWYIIISHISYRVLKGGFLNMRKESKVFQAETKELLNLMINSIYTNKEIFLTYSLFLQSF